MHDVRIDGIWNAPLAPPVAGTCAHAPARPPAEGSQVVRPSMADVELEASEMRLRKVDALSGHLEEFDPEVRDRSVHGRAAGTAAALPPHRGGRLARGIDPICFFRPRFFFRQRAASRQPEQRLPPLTHALPLNPRTRVDRSFARINQPDFWDPFEQAAITERLLEQVLVRPRPWAVGCGRRRGHGGRVAAAENGRRDTPHRERGGISRGAAWAERCLRCAMPCTPRSWRCR